MTNVISALTARTQLGQLMERATQKGEQFVVRRRGRPSIVIMGINEYIDIVAPAPEWMKAIHAEAKQKGLHKLTMRQIDAEIAAARRERRKIATVTTPAK